MLRIANITGDSATAALQLTWAAGKPQEYQFLSTEAISEDHIGRRAKARDMLRRAAGMARQQNLAGAANTIVAQEALTAAVVGQCAEARSQAVSAILPDQGPGNAGGPILALAFCGDDTAAKKAADEITKRSPLHTFWKSVWLPSIQASTELKRDQPQKAIELLEAAKPCERAWSTPVYLRGLAYLDLHKGPEAAAEFRKILDHKGFNWGIFYPLAQAGFARATALSGDTAAAKKAYQDFFDMWKDADTDLPPLMQPARNSRPCTDRCTYRLT